MQLLDGLLALGGDTRNTVPLTGITVAEARVLQAIHGMDAVHDVQPLDRHVRVHPRAEMSRLAEKYRSKDEGGKPVVLGVFPGGQGMPETVEDLMLPESCFKVLSRVTTATSTPKRRRKTAETAPIPAPAAPPDPNSADHLFDDEDGVDEAEDEDAFA